MASDTFCGTGIGGSAPLPGDPDNNSILSAVAAFGGIDVSWSYPTTNPQGVAYTNLYRSTSGTEAPLTVYQVVSGNFFYDKTTRHGSIEYFYWIEIVSINGTVGEIIGPVSASAKPPIEQVLQGLTGQIDNGMLDQFLKEELDQIPVLDSKIGTETANRLADNEILGEAFNQVEAYSAATRSLLAAEQQERTESYNAFMDGLNARAQEIVDERNARIAGDDVEALARFNAIVAEQEARAAAIQQEAQARMDAIAAEVADRIADVNAERDARILAIQKEQGTRAAAISAEETARTDGDTALGVRIDSLTVVANGNSADITAEQSARASADTALASDVSALQVKSGDNTAAILEEQEARLTQNSLRASQLAAISAAYSANNATIHSLEDVRISDRNATATRIDGIEVEVGDNSAAIYQEQQARADGDSALSTQVSVLSAKIDSLPTYSNSFETGAQYDRWETSTDHTIRPENADSYVGEGAAVIGSTASTVVTTAPPFGVAAVIPSGSAGAFLSRRLRLSLAVKAPSTGASSELAMGYATADWFSGWTYFAPQVSWSVVQTFVDVPEGATGDHYLVIWADTSGTGGEVLVDRALVEVADAAIPEITAEITAEQEARAAGDAALTTDINAAVARIADNESGLITESRTRADEDAALSTQLTTLTSRVGVNETSIVDEATARSTEDTALGSRITAVDARVDGSRTLISQETTARSNADTALGQQITSVDARVDESRSLITAEQTARSTADTAMAADIQTLTAATDGLAADISGEQTVRASADAALASDVTDLWAGVDGNESRITQEATTRAFEDSLAASINQVIAASKGTSQGATYALDSVRVVEQGVVVTRVAGIEASLANTQAQVSTIEEAYATADAALASQLSTVKADLGGTISQVQTDLSSESVRLGGRIDTNAAAITTVQSNLDSGLTSVQQALDTQVTELRGDVEANSTALTTAQTNLGDDIAVVETRLDASVSGEILLRNGTFASGGLTGWVLASDATVVGMDTGSTEPAVAGMPTRYATHLTPSSADPHQVFLEGEELFVSRDEDYVFRLDYAAGSTATAPQVVMRIQWRDVNGYDLSVAEHAVTADSTTWTRMTPQTVKAPEGARYAAVQVLGDTQAGDMYVANLIAQRSDATLGALYTAKVDVNGLVGGFGIFNNGEEVEAGFDVDRFSVGKTTNDKVKPFVVVDGQTFINEAVINKLTFNKLRDTTGNLVVDNGNIKAQYLDAENLQVKWANITDASIASADIQNGAIDSAKIANASINSAKIASYIQSDNYSSSRGWRINKNGSAVFNDITVRRQLQIGTGVSSIGTRYVNYSSGWRETLVATVNTGVASATWTGPDKTMGVLIGRESGGVYTKLTSGQGSRVAWGFRAEIVPMTYWSYSAGNTIHLRIYALHKYVYYFRNYRLRWRLYEIT